MPNVKTGHITTFEHPFLSIRKTRLNYVVTCAVTYAVYVIMNQDSEKDDGGSETASAAAPPPPPFPHRRILVATRQKPPTLSRGEGERQNDRGSSTAWKPFKKLKITDADGGETEKLFRTMRGILNRITPTNFFLVDKLRALEIKTVEQLDVIVKMIFERVVEEPLFVEVYAQMVKYIYSIKVPVGESRGENGSDEVNDEGNYVHFRKLLQDRSKKEMDLMFECDSAIEDEKDFVEAVKNNDLKYAKAKRRFLNYILFMGERLRLDIGDEPLMQYMQHMIYVLMNVNARMIYVDANHELRSHEYESEDPLKDDESIEAVCRLMMRIGKNMDHAQGKSKMDGFFRDLERIVKNKKTTSARVRFLLMDVVDLRKGGWIPRRVDVSIRPEPINGIVKYPYLSSSCKKKRNAVTFASSSVTTCGDPTIEYSTRISRSVIQSVLVQLFVARAKAKMIISLSAFDSVCSDP